jgi:tetratricopeptide (TPR) repeat protein
MLSSSFLKMLILTITIPLFLYCEEDKPLFTQANEQYKLGNFEQAYDFYNQITDKKPHIYYNLGNCAYKMNRLGYALFHWRQAEKDWGIWGRGELLSNIKLVKSLLENKSGIKKQSKVVGVIGAISNIKHIVISFVRSIPLVVLQMLFLLLWFILFFYMGICKNHKTIIIPIVLSLAVFCGSMLAIKYGLGLCRHSIVVVEKTEMYSGPGNNYQILGFLFEGQEGIMTKQSDKFYKIKFGGRIGWVDEKSLETI